MCVQYSALLLNRLTICIIMIGKTDAFLMLINTSVCAAAFSEDTFSPPFKVVTFKSNSFWYETANASVGN